MKQKDFEAFARNSLYRLVSCANSKTVGKFNFSYLFPQYALFRARFRGKQNGRRLCFKFFPLEIVKKLSESLQIKFWGKKNIKTAATLGLGKKKEPASGRAKKGKNVFKIHRHLDLKLRFFVTL